MTKLYAELPRLSHYLSLDLTAGRLRDRPKTDCGLYGPLCGSQTGFRRGLENRQTLFPCVVAITYKISYTVSIQAVITFGVRKKNV